MAEVRRRAGAVQVMLSGDEATALAGLAAQVATLLADDGAQPTAVDADPLEAMVGLQTAPVAPSGDRARGRAPLEARGAPQTEPGAPSDDPAVRRLLPAAYADDTLSGEFRRLMDGE